MADFLIAILLLIFVRLTSGTPLEYLSDIKESFPSTQSDLPRELTKHTASLAVGSNVVWHLCGASIVRDSLVMTAGHCIEPLLDWDKELLPTSHVIVGTDEWNKGGHRLRIKDHHLHPEWDYVLIKNNIGFVELLDKVIPSETVGIIALNYDWYDGGEPCYTTGIDHSKVSKKLQIVNMLSITPQQCVDGVYAAGGRWSPPIYSHEEICTSYHDWDGSGLCNGDGGSALVLKKKNQQIGVVSWGFHCIHQAPCVFVRLSKFKDYINFILKEHN